MAEPGDRTEADRFGLARFAQAQAPVWDAVVAELTAGRKRSHWMWFVFPQLRGLGHSTMARHYGISGLDEARAYAAHALLGPRLRQATALVLGHAGRPLQQIFSPPDDLKFGSCMTLFAAAVPDEPVFAQALRQHLGGRGDERTLALLGGAAAGG
ncbi:MAG: DUF1810 domain-containing protein [Aquabacterium sp.]|nr:DUF1810 domain-containing protein [Aquabacterium sp.]